MTSCSAANLLYKLVPLRPWRALLIRVHFERCSRCQKDLASAAEARSLFVQDTGSRASGALWPGIARSLAGGDDRMPEKRGLALGSRPWRWAAAGIVLAVLAGYFVRKDFRPNGSQVVAAAPPRFELEYVRVGGRPADAYVYQPQGSDMTIVWAEKAN